MRQLSSGPNKPGRYQALILVLVWTFIFVLPFLLRIALFRNDPRNGSLTDIFFSFLTIIALFYLHTWVIYPLLKRRNGRLWYGMAVLAAFGLFLLSMNVFMHDLSAVGEAHGLPNRPGKANPARIALFFPFALVIFCSFSYRVYIEKIRQNDRIGQLETTQLKTELDFLRSQISPHFMFNLMNTLVSMARKKSELLEPSLIDLSQLMRYMLYDSSNQKIDLAREIEYLKSYSTLQLLRFGDTVRFNLFRSGNPQGYAIEPMLLIPFVENAFKHGVEEVDDPMIDVVLDIDNVQNILALKVMNSTGRVQQREVAGSGIGLANVRRRLDLLYPGSHTIDIEAKDALYTVHLTINL
jgi:hypothetical protein